MPTPRTKPRPLLWLACVLVLTARAVVVADLIMDAVSAFVDVNGIADSTGDALKLADKMKANVALPAQFDETFPLSTNELGLLLQIYENCGTDDSLALRTWCTGLAPNGSSVDGEQLCPTGVRTHPCSGRVLDRANASVQYLWPWQGIKCDVFTDPTTITNIYLPGQGLKCRLQDLDFSHMVSLEQLDLGQNELYGPFPLWLGNMTMLRFVNLRGNHIRSNLPLSFGDNFAIEVIDLADNLLTATSLSFFKIFKRLRYMDLSSNRFNVTLPAGFFSGEYLEHVNLSHNMFHGPLPLLPQLKHLAAFDVSHNDFEGELPRGLSLWGRADPNDPAEDPITEVLDFSFNRFSGSVPIVLNQTMLRRFAMQFNQFTGILPPPPPSLISHDTPAFFRGNQFLCPLPQLTPSLNEFGDLTCFCPVDRRSIPAGRAAIDCQPCPRGSFANSSTGYQCTACPLGHFAITKKSTGGTNETSDGLSECVPCEPGTFANTTGSDQCFPCEPGSSTSGRGQAACSPCRPGEYADAPGAIQCNMCLPGSMSSKSGSQKCAPCRPGTFTSFTGEFACLPCPRGQFQDQAGAIECRECPHGHIAPHEGHSECHPCRAGSFYEEASRSCVRCPPNSFTDKDAQAQCTVCPPGSAAEGLGNRHCEPSSTPGFGRTVRGQTAAACPPGHFNNGSFVACQPCPRGTFASGPRSTHCSKCSLGSFASTEGSTRCELAPVGTCVAEEGAWRPQRCPPDHFADAEGSSQCTKCPADSSSTFGGQAKCDLLVDGEVLQRVAWPQVWMALVGVRAADLQSNATLHDAFLHVWRMALNATGVTGVEPHLVAVTANGGRAVAQLALEVLPPARPKRRGSNQSLISSIGNAYGDAKDFVHDTTDSATQWFNRLTGKTTDELGDYTKVPHANVSEMVPQAIFKTALARQLRHSPIPDIRAAASLVDYRLLNETFQATRPIRCPRGSFFTKDASTGVRKCVPCPVGTHADEDGLTDGCKPCPTRHYANVEGLDLCDECPWGHGAMPGATACEKCAFFSRACGEFWKNVLLTALVAAASGLTMWQRSREVWSGRTGAQQRSEDAALVAAIRTFGHAPW